MPRKDKLWVKVGVQVGVGVFLAVIFLASQNDIFSKETSITFFDVGQGDATLIRSKGVDLLVDGSRSNAVLEDLGEFMPFYDRSIEMVVLTHPDYDHHFGLIEVMKRYLVGSILETGIYCEKKLCQAWEENKEGELWIARRGITFELPEGKAEVLYPKESLEGLVVEDMNEASVVLCVRLKDAHFLLMGDAGKQVEQELLDDNYFGECDNPDVLKVGHHGSKTATSDAFVERVRPRYGIISAGKNNDYGHPHLEVLEVLERNNVEALRTDVSGSIHFLFRDDGMVIETEK